MTETKHIPDPPYRKVSQMVSKRPKQALHQTKILVKTTKKIIKNYPHQITKFFIMYTQNNTEQINKN